MMSLMLADVSGEVSALGHVSLLAEQTDTPGRDEGGVERTLCWKTLGKNSYINSGQLWLHWKDTFKQLQNSLFWAVARRRPGRTRKLCARGGRGVGVHRHQRLQHSGPQDGHLAGLTFHSEWYF